MLEKIFFTIICSGLFFIPCKSQVITDSLANDFRSFAAKHFSRYRTVNLFWETKSTHDYILKLGGKEIEQGKKKDLHTIKFSTMIPIIRQKKISLYANVKYDCYKSESNNNDTQSAVFTTDTYNFYEGGLNGAYYISLFNKPFILSANIALDGWDRGFGKLQARLSAMMVIVKKPNINFSAGIIGMSLFDGMPIMPLITYWYRFSNPNWSVDIIFPSQFYLRYQMRTQRFSIGSSLSRESFYLKTNLKGMPETCYYSDAVLKPEIHYEYIINKHFFLFTHVGLSIGTKSGLYNKNRKSIKVKEGKNEVEQIFKQKHSPIPFINFGVSYSLFK
ncbi:hypothetical protein [Parabacteroides sp.]